MRQGEPVLARPGPKTTGPLPLAEVWAEIEQLRHGRKRSRGTLALRALYESVLSRRALSGLVAEERNQRNKTRRQIFKRVALKEPNLAWAIDATERGRDQRGRQLFVHAVQDLLC